MALTKAQKDAMAERYKSLSDDEKAALKDLVGTPGTPDILKTLETIQADILELKKGKEPPEPAKKGFLETLLGG